MTKIILTMTLLALGLYLLRYSRAKKQSLRSRRRKIIEQMRLRIEEAHTEKNGDENAPHGNQ